MDTAHIKSNVDLYIDSQEYSEHQDIGDMFKDRGFNIILKKLEVSDYNYGNVLIEQKYPLDFIESTYNGRIFQQCQDMAQNIEFHSYILICGKHKDFEFYGYSLKNIISIVTSLNVRGVTTFCVDNEETFVEYASQLFQKHNDDKKRYMNPVRRPVTLSDNIEITFSTIPGIGNDLAKTLKEKFTNVDRLYKASIQDLRDISGIGPKRARNIFDYLHEEVTIEEK